MEKDLDQAKKLAAVLETRAAEVASYKPIFPVGAPVEQTEGDEVPAEATAKTENIEVDQEEIDACRGSKAVEDRIDKIASETLDTDEKGNPDREKYVCPNASALYFSEYLTLFMIGCLVTGYVSVLPT